MWFNVVIFQWRTRTSTALSVLRPPCSRMADTTCLTSGCRRLGRRPLRTPLTNLTVHAIFVISYITGCARIKIIPQHNFSIKFTIPKYTPSNCLMAEYAWKSFDPLLEAVLLLLENDTWCHCSTKTIFEIPIHCTRQYATVEIDLATHANMPWYLYNKSSHPHKCDAGVMLTCCGMFNGICL